MPSGEAARAVYDVVEQVRVESLGARRMPGVAQNLDQLWAERCEQRGYRRVRSKDDAPFAEVVGLMVREKLMGTPMPEAAREMVELFREEIEKSAGKDFEKLAETTTNQENFSRALRRLIRDLHLSDDAMDMEDESNDDQDQSENPDGESNETGEDGQDSSETHGYGASGDETDDSQDQDDSSETTADQAQTEMQMGSGDEDEPGRAERPWLPPGALSNEPRGQQYHAYTTKFDEEVDAQDLCDADEAGAPAPAPRPAARAPAGRHRQAGQPPAAQADGAAEPLLGVRPRRGHARRCAAGAHHHQPDAGAVLQDGEGHQLPRHRGVAA